jgi:hypothetical protein
MRAFWVSHSPFYRHQHDGNPRQLTSETPAADVDAVIEMEADEWEPRAALPLGE